MFVSAMPQSLSVSELGVQDVFNEFCSVDKRAAEILKANNIDGNDLGDLTSGRLREMGITDTNVITNIQRKKTKLQNKPPLQSDVKTFCDPIHGHVELHPACTLIMDTPEFQRLHYLKQLGPTFLVYPGASHSRFEHSIGTSYLAGSLLASLRQHQPELNITPQDILCVQIAALCNDLGRGPMSYVYDNFIFRLNPESEWNRQRASVEMLDHLLNKNEIDLSRYDIDDKELFFIKELMQGVCMDCPSGDAIEPFPYKGRGKYKAFLYEVINNRSNGIDVGKFDYFARDCYYLGLPGNFDHRRYMMLARVVEADGRLRICTRDKDEIAVHEMFQTRAMLHRRAYKHKTVMALELMFEDILVEANSHLKVDGIHGALLKSASNMELLSQLDDSVFLDINKKKDPSFKEAQGIYRNILTRKLHMFVGQAILQDGKGSTQTDKRQIVEQVKEQIAAQPCDQGQLGNDRYIVAVVEYNYGMAEKNPLEHVYFYDKNTPCVATKFDKKKMPEMLPQYFQESHLRVYCRRLEDVDCTNDLAIAKSCFEAWRQRDKYTIKPTTTL